MRRTYRQWTWGAAALAAVAAAACSRDANPPATRVAGPAAPAARIAEGTRVRMTLRDAVEFPGLAAGAAVREIGTSEAEAVVRNGRASDPATGALLAGARGRADGEREFRYTDADGHRHRLVLAAEGERSPLRSVRYEIDGEPALDADYTWDPREGGSVLREQTVTVRRHGRVVARHVRTAGWALITAGPSDAGGAPAADGGGLPPILRMDAVPVCEEEWAVYIGASATLIISAEAAYLLRTKASISALATAFAAWNVALDKINYCLTINAGDR